MRAMRLPRQADVSESPLQSVEVEPPEPGPGRILVKVAACGLCHTDLHTVEGDLPLHRQPIIPGHQIVGEVAALGEGADRFAVGDRVGIAWLHETCGTCRFCTSGRENLCVNATFTGWDTDGGYAEYTTVGEQWAYAVPEGLDAAEATPLLCGGIIGYRAWRMAGVPGGGRLGLFGFGNSAHLTIQIARHAGVEVSVFTRSAEHRRHAEELGAVWVGEAGEKPPHPLDGAIMFAPAGALVPPALKVLEKGGTLALAGIHLSPIPEMTYEEHLYHEKVLRSVANNTREDGEALLKLAAEIPLRTTVTRIGLEEANEALQGMKASAFNGDAVLVV